MTPGGGGGVQFFNGTTLADITDKDVDVFLRADGDTITAAVLCRTFVQDGALWLDFIPELNRKYTAPMPDDAVVSRNEVDLTIGRYGIFLLPKSPAGQMLESMIEAKKRQQGGR